MQLPRYMFLNNKTEAPGEEYILLTRPPYHLMQVFFFKNDGEEQRFFSGNDGKLYENITGYRIYILWRGTITGRMPVTTETKSSIDAALIGAAKFYENERINDKKKFYERYKVR